MAVKVITTVGTSIFTNYQKKDEVKRKYKGFRYADINIALESLNPRDGYQAIERNNIDNEYEIDEVKIEIERWLETAKEKSSAEIETLYKIAEEEKQDLEVYLLATDTILSVVACELIKEWFDKYPSVNRKKIRCVSIEVIEGLQVMDSDNFKEKGLQNLLRAIKSKKDKTTILNISGGYKAVIPFLTLIGQLEKMPLKYMYEDSAQVITIGKLPFSFDWSIIDAYATFLFDTAKITGSKIGELVNMGLLEVVGEAKNLTPLGDLVKAYLENEDVPFQTTTMGYFVEYKLYEYYNNQKYDNYNTIKLGYKLSDDPQFDLEDADLWMENEQKEVVVAEIKPASIKPKVLNSKIKKIISFIENKPVTLKEFWIILYDYEGFEEANDIEWCQKVINNNTTYLFQNIIFKIKKITINKNVIDGSKNRMTYHEFMRSLIPLVNDIYST